MYAPTLARISAEASTISPLSIVVTILTAPFFAVGWVVGLVFVVMALMWSALVVGFRTGRGTPGE